MDSRNDTLICINPPRVCAWQDETKLFCSGLTDFDFHKYLEPSQRLCNAFLGAWLMELCPPLQMNWD